MLKDAQKTYKTRETRVPNSPWIVRNRRFEFPLASRAARAKVKDFTCSLAQLSLASRAARARAWRADFFEWSNAALICC